MDDFLYDEPEIIPEPATAALAVTAGKTKRASGNLPDARSYESICRRSLSP
jgi:hypothetical protein